MQSSNLSGTWGDVAGEVDNLLQEHREGVRNENPYIGIKKDHWRSSNVPRCMNMKCDKKFSLTERHHHCRRCGNVFCRACCCYKRRLNVLACPDPGGRMYKVCEACFEEPQTLGAHRNLIDVFNSHRWALVQRTAKHGDVVDGRVDLIPGLKSRSGALRACSRLTDGFQISRQANVLSKAATNLTSLVKRPSWKQAPNYVYERLVPQCRHCSTHFSLIHPRHFCCVCGSAMCRPCSGSDLIVYVDPSEEAMTVKWAIIKIIGCPDKEPAVCEYLRLCSPCKDKLCEIQCQHYQQSMQPVDTDSVWQDMDKIYSGLHNIREKIDKYLPMYQDLVESLYEGSPSKQDPGSQTKLLAKAQGDLSDHFTKLVVTAQGMKTLKPNTKCQLTIVKNMTKSTFQFYHENIFVFREQQRRLEEITPIDVLNDIQNIVNSDAINSCYLSVKQLVLEILHATTKYNLHETLLLIITPLEEEVLNHLQKTVVRSGENWEEHQSCVNLLLSIQLKDHKFIRIPGHVLDGSMRERLLWQRATHLLVQIQLQLLAKTSDNSFTSTKAALDDMMPCLLDQIPQS